MESHSFPKSQRLCSRKAIETLFAGGSHALSAFPLRAVYRHAPEGPTQVLMSVSKRRLHHAVDRNRAKRQLREAWRLHRPLLASVPLPLHVAFIWMADEPQPSDLIVRKLKNLLHRIREAEVPVDATKSGDGHPAPTDAPTS